MSYTATAYFNRNKNMKKEDKKILRQMKKWTAHEDVRHELYRSIVGSIIWLAIVAVCIASFAIWFADIN
jgi:hypothetical protein